MGQPPSGGCVLKLKELRLFVRCKPPAAFGRLCVETEDGAVAQLEEMASRLRAAVC